MALRELKVMKQDKKRAAAGTTPMTEKKKTKKWCTKPGIFLPLEIMASILSQLPAKSLLRFRCACKQWRSLIYDAHFINEHLKKGALRSQTLIGDIMHTSEGISLYEFADNKITKRCSFNTKLREETSKFSSTWCRLTNSANGLIVAFYALQCDPYPYLLNPITGECIRLPKSNRKSVSETESLSSLGLGYINSTGDYKLVRLYYHTRVNYGHCACEVLTLGTQVWRFVDVPYGFEALEPVRPAFINGALYWLVNKYENHTHVRGILTLDIKEEKFGFISISQITACSRWTSILTLQKLEGHICLVEEIKDQSEQILATTRIWMLRDSTNHVWEAKYNIDMYDENPCVGSHVIDIKDGNMLMQNQESWNVIYSYDLHKRIGDMLYSRASLQHLNIIEGSLISPASLFRN